MNFDWHVSKAVFATTNWTNVLRAQVRNSQEARESFGQLIASYWYPLYTYSRRAGYSDHDGLDLTQGFFTHLLEQEALETVSSQKGRFRFFLLASFKNYIANERRRDNTQRRGGNIVKIPLTQVDFKTRYDCEPTHHETAERLFDRSWVESLLERVRLRLAQDYATANRVLLYELLEPHLTNRGDAMPRNEICEETGLSSAAIAMSLHRMRRRFGELLREEVAATVEKASDIEDEIRELLMIVTQR